MSSPLNKNSSSSKSFLAVETIVLAAIVWAVISLLFFLLFSVALPGQENPTWYAVTTYVLEEVAFLGAAILCFRNWRSPQIVSGRNVWLAIGLGMVSYFIGNLVFGVWELIWLQDPAVSPADLFFISTYVFLIWGMVLAILPRRLNLELWQWIVMAAIALIGSGLAYVLYNAEPAQPQATLASPAIVQTAPAPATTPPSAQVPAQSAPPLEGTTPADAEDAAEAQIAPGWVLSLEEKLAPFEDVVGLLYVVADVVLLIIATTLLLAFWGGRFSQSWRMIAAAALSLYIADMWFLYASSRVDYQSGSLPEVFWVFCGVLFAIGAALEYDLSTRSRRGTSRRRT